MFNNINNFLPSFGLTYSNFIYTKKIFFLSKKTNFVNFINNWILSTNHKKIAVMYFIFVIIAGFTGLILATIIRIELAYPGQSILFNNAEKYLTVISIHGIVMVFFLVIPVIFGAFGNFLLPTQLGIRDVAFPRLNSFMFWFTPAGFVLLMHILFFDKSYNLTYYINYADLRIQLRNRFFLKDSELIELNNYLENSSLAVRFSTNNFLSRNAKIVFEEVSSKDYISSIVQIFLDIPSYFITYYCKFLFFINSSINDIYFFAIFQFNQIISIIHFYCNNTNTLFCAFMEESYYMIYGVLLFNYAYIISFPDIYVDYCIYIISGILIDEINSFFIFKRYCNFIDLFLIGSELLPVIDRSTWLDFLLYDIADVYADFYYASFGISTFLIDFYEEYIKVIYFLTVNNLVDIYLNYVLLFPQNMCKVYSDTLFYLTNNFFDVYYNLIVTPFENYKCIIVSFVELIDITDSYFDEFTSLLFEIYEEMVLFFFNPLNSFLFDVSDIVDTVLSFYNYLPIECVWLQESLYSDYDSIEGDIIKYVDQDFTFFNFEKILSLELENSINAYVEKIIENDLYNWRYLKFERETWRSMDDFGLSKRNYFDRTRFYTGIFEPDTLISRVSIWMPNHLIPGWAFITPYSSRLLYTNIGKVDIALIVVLFASLGSVFSAVNYVITYRYIAAPVFKNRKELRSFFVDALLVASRMMLLANPALIIGILLLLSDRHFGTSVFDFSGGGDTILFQHLFWFFGHPEVYIIIIPCFGFLNSILPYYLKKRLSGRLSLQFSMYTIAIMGFAVWGHHMYMVGLSNSVRSLYSTMTVMISVPASTKILHWCVTLINTSFTVDVTLLFLLAFMYFFVLGGLSGMFLAHIGFDILFHDTFFVIGHFHVMLAGAAMSCIFGAFYFYFSAIFGVAYNRIFAYLHFLFYFFGQIITLTPMFWLGYCGMPRRVMDYPEAFGGWQSIVSSGHLLILISIIFFLLMIIFSFLENIANINKTKGVGRLNTRLSFYTYEMRKTRYKSYKNINLQNSPLRRDLVKLELKNYEYTIN